MPLASDYGDGYSPWMGMIYVFNLIVGTGSLTLPAAFAQAGWALGLVFIITLSFMSYLTVTFVIEAMASANAIIHWRRQRQLKKRETVEASGVSPVNTTTTTTTTAATTVANDSSCATVAFSGGAGVNNRFPAGAQNSDENSCLLEGDSTALNEYYSISETVEMGKMASFFFSKAGINVFYVIIILYLYGDLSIYAAAVAKSLRDVSCTYVPANFSCNHTLPLTTPCWHSMNLTRWDAYRFFLVTFVVCLGSFVFFNVQKTKYLQIVTTVMRWAAFSLMLVLAVRRLVVSTDRGEGARERGHPAAVTVSGLPTLFGVCVYSFMCHHSLPSLITPVNNKKHLNVLLLADYMLINVFYLLLALTGVFAFSHVYDLYTLNFQPDNCAGHSVGWFERVLDYFLTLFPVFTLSTNFPVIAITLRNNLYTLCVSDGRRHGFFMRRLLFPSLALLPPTAIALVFQDLRLLVGVTGSYAGSGVQYVVPALLVYYSRRTTLTLIGLGVRNKHRSCFQHGGWIVFVLVWAAVCVVFVTTDHVQNWLAL